ncbi:Tol biopolymer transport system component [Albibacterium bauzanense]|uniref:Tol biopolymer transport system component n=2 Tax=Albibacterium bauzanense TaxID=653929 RepID=A0A4V2PYC5_9SPHI|nr:Tol biopolymer transport system component [Albibacterium bauzanense]
MKYMDTRNFDHRLLVRFSLSFLFLILTFSAHAQYFGQNKMRYKKLDFKVYETPHFDLYYYLKNDSLIKNIAKESEVWYELHQQVFRDTFTNKNPLIIYNNHPDFQQTTAIQGTIGVGTGGVTEGFKNRVVMPIMQINSQTRHVLGHEMVHAFQYHSLIEGDSTQLENIANLPLWMVEGMAEYLSIGKKDAFTAMWMRDAYLNKDIPSLRDLTESNKYFPYRYGQAFWSYIGSTYGDTVIVPLFKATAKYGYQMAIQQVFGYNETTLSNLWKTAIENTYKPLLTDTAQVPIGKIIIDKNNAGNTNVSPAVSPDGKYVAFLSEKDLLSIDLYLAEAETGKIIRKLTSRISNSHIDEFSYIESAGTFSPDSRKFAYSVFSGGRNKLLITDVTNGKTLFLEGMGDVAEFSNIAWAPDGNSVVFSGLKEGQSDLYQYMFQNKELKQLTNDAYSEYHPAFSHSGKLLVYSTDRGSFSRDDKTADISFNLSIMDMASNETRDLGVFPLANNLNPQFSGDDSQIYFLSNRDGFRNMYRYTIATNSTEQLTDYFTGISGITEYSPALSVSANDDIIYSYYRSQTYTIYNAKANDFQAKAVNNEDVDFAAAMIPPFQTYGVDVINTNLRNFNNFSRIDTSLINHIPYTPKFKLDYLASSGMGVSVGSRYGSGLASGVQGIFSDILGRNQIFAGLSINGEIYDFGGQVAYINQSSRLNWGGAVSHIPFISGLVSYSIDPNSTASPTGVAYLDNYDIIRTFQEQVEGFVAYPFSRTTRLEAGAAFSHYSYRIDRYTNYYAADESGYPLYFIGGNRHKLSSEEAKDTYNSSFDSFTIQQLNTAFVGDNSVFGVAAPLDGYRYRLGVEQYFGDYNFRGYTVDLRKYHRMKHVTLAARAYTYMRVGKDDDKLYPLFLGYPYLIRGYESASFYNDRTGAASNFNYNQLTGTRIAVANFEARIPFTGPERLSLVKSSMLFSDLNIFFDMGLAWSEGDKIAFKSQPDLLETIADPNNPNNFIAIYERVPAMSAGVSLRINMFGYFVIEPYYAIPFQRKDVKFGTFGINFAPGW